MTRSDVAPTAKLPRPLPHLPTPPSQPKVATAPSALDTGVTLITEEKTSYWYSFSSSAIALQIARPNTLFSLALALLNRYKELLSIIYPQNPTQVAKDLLRSTK